jgi:hypothetical protein
MADDPETLKLAEEGIRQSTIYEALRVKILAVTDHSTRQVFKAHQVFLMKLDLLRNCLRGYVDLAAPSTVRGISSISVMLYLCCCALLPINVMIFYHKLHMLGFHPLAVTMPIPIW